MTDDITDDLSEPVFAANVFAHAQAVNWLRTRIPAMDVGMAAFVAHKLHELYHPYLKIGLYARMADDLRAAGLNDIANVLDASKDRYLDELLKEEAWAGNAPSPVHTAADPTTDTSRPPSPDGPPTPVT